jgi:A/G-specific adenine glycosylase
LFTHKHTNIKMLKINQIDSFQRILLHWYDTHKRELPWRESNDPYIIWVSEIILQQTQVVQGLEYFYRFTKQFPTVNALANANIDIVLRYWQGLGYYSRAHNMLHAAKEIAEKYNGQFPSTYEEIRKLKGIGDYTAAAICSFAYNLPYPAIDGNVYRFTTRYFGIHTPIDSTIGKKDIAEFSMRLLNKKYPGKHNQAMMEFGALQCTPHNPNCDNCPFKKSCIAHIEHTVELLPIKEKKTKIHNRFFYYICICNNEHTYLKKRSNNEIWKGLFEFPVIETQEKISTKDLLLSTDFTHLTGKNCSIIKELPEIKHVLSHQHIFAQCICVDINKETDTLKSYQKILISDIENFAVSRLTEKFLEKIGW